MIDMGTPGLSTPQTERDEQHVQHANEVTNRGSKQHQCQQNAWQNHKESHKKNQPPAISRERGGGSGGGVRGGGGGPNPPPQLVLSCYVELCRRCCGAQASREVSPRSRPPLCHLVSPGTSVCVTTAPAPGHWGGGGAWRRLEADLRSLTVAEGAGGAAVFAGSWPSPHRVQCAGRGGGGGE